LTAGSELPLTCADDGKTVLLISESIFELASRDSTARHWRPELHDGFFVLRVSAAERDDARLHLTAGSAQIAVTVHPDYMSIGRLR
jgi:hypothetical protein